MCEFNCSSECTEFSVGDDMKQFHDFNALHMTSLYAIIWYLEIPQAYGNYNNLELMALVVFPCWFISWWNGGLGEAGALICLWRMHFKYLQITGLWEIWWAKNARGARANIVTWYLKICDAHFETLFFVNWSFLWRDGDVVLFLKNVRNDKFNNRVVLQKRTAKQKVQRRSAEEWLFYINSEILKTNFSSAF